MVGLSKVSANRFLPASRQRYRWPSAHRLIRGDLDQRLRELDGAVVAWRRNSFDAEPHRGRVAGERKLDGLARSSLGLPVNNAAAANVALLREPIRRQAGFARPALLERPPARHGRFGNSTSEVYLKI
jgi:hypothetical protein